MLHLIWLCFFSGEIQEKEKVFEKEEKAQTKGNKRHVYLKSIKTILKRRII